MLYTEQMHGVASEPCVDAQQNCDALNKYFLAGTAASDKTKQNKPDIKTKKLDIMAKECRKVKWCVPNS